MREWFAFVVSGAMTSIGVVAAASGCGVDGPFYGACVLLMIGALWYSNMKLGEDYAS